MELRNEGYVTGIVSNVDGFMNVTMKKVTFVDPLGNKKDFDDFFVQNRLIRIVQIPSKIDIKAALMTSRTKNLQNPQISRARQKILKVREERRKVDSANAALIAKDL